MLMLNRLFTLIFLCMPLLVIAADMQPAGSEAGQLRMLAIRDIRVVDPTRPLGKVRQRQSESVPVLSSILRSGSAYLAIVDGEVIKDNDVLPNGYRVSQINGQSVWLDKDGKSLQLGLSDD